VVSRFDPALASVIVFGALAPAACSPSSPSAPVEEELAAITEFNERYLDAINDEDIGRLSSLTTDGHIMLPPNRPPIVGKTANDEANGRAFQTFDFDETWTPVETVVAGDWGFQRGTYTVVARPKAGGATRTSTGNFLRIYQKQPDGTWRMTRDMFNSDRAPAAAQQ
jgi:ketosteroid isomerase-like protein